MKRFRRRFGYRSNPELRRRAAELLWQYRRLLRTAGYRVVGRHVAISRGEGPPGVLGGYDRARIIGVRFRERSTPRLVLTWGRRPRRSGPVKLTVTRNETRTEHE